MFDYPLKKREIYIFLGCKAGMHEFERALNGLLEESALYKIGNFYSLFNNYALAERRSRGYQKATVLLKKAAKAAMLVSAFPFVRGVAISGSLSKKFADKDADIDLFIVTVANRLWIARTLLHVFKKITFLFNMQDMFCMNYFLDETASCILEKNIYTATEVATIMPLHGAAVFEKFYAANIHWTKNFLPNNYMHVSAAREISSTWLTALFEKMLNNRAGDQLDTLLMKLTASSWKNKTLKKKKNSKGMLLSMHTGKHFSKPDPENFQKNLLLRYRNCLAEVFNQYEQSARMKNNFL